MSTLLLAFVYTSFMILDISTASTSQLEPGEIPRTPPQKPLKIHPTPDKNRNDQDYTMSNRRKSKLYSDGVKPASKVRSTYVDRSPTPPLPQDRKRKPRSPSPRKRRRERSLSQNRERRRRSPTPPRHRKKQTKETSFSNWVDLTKKKSKDHLRIIWDHYNFQRATRGQPPKFESTMKFWNRIFMCSHDIFGKPYPLVK